MSREGALAKEGGGPARSTACWCGGRISGQGPSLHTKLLLLCVSWDPRPLHPSRSLSTRAGGWGWGPLSRAPTETQGSRRGAPELTKPGRQSGTGAGWHAGGPIPEVPAGAGDGLAGVRCRRSHLRCLFAATGPSGQRPGKGGLGPGGAVAIGTRTPPAAPPQALPRESVPGSGLGGWATLLQEGVHAATHRAPLASAQSCFGALLAGPRPPVRLSFQGHCAGDACSQWRPPTGHALPMGTRGPPASTQGGTPLCSNIWSRRDRPTQTPSCRRPHPPGTLPGPAHPVVTAASVHPSRRPGPQVQSTRCDPAAGPVGGAGVLPAAGLASKPGPIPY